ncbi:MAG: hypothetical protein U0163_13765 [Gemmatimonadaceae bacterium]
MATTASHPKWQSVLDTFDAVVRPCMHDARHREFRASGSIGTSVNQGLLPLDLRRATQSPSKTMAASSWSTGKAPSGSEGQSFNIFDRSFGKWRQTWVDNVGGQHDYRGSLINGNMVFVGDTPAPNGALGRVPTRLTFFHISADSVRQFSEQSSDSGKTWQTAYDLTYVRRKP